MGTQTTVVLVAFLALHIAVILSITSIASPDWLNGSLQPNASHVNSTNYTSKGLWQLCEDGTCGALNETMQPRWFRSVQSLSVIGTGGNFLALLCSYAFLLLSKCKNSRGFNMIISLINCIATLALLAAVIVFGVKALDNTADIPDSLYNLEYGWSYYLSIAALVFSAIALLANMREACLLRNVRAGYVDI